MDLALSSHPTGMMSIDEQYPTGYPNGLGVDALFAVILCGSVDLCGSIEVVSSILLSGLSGYTVRPSKLPNETSLKQQGSVGKNNNKPSTSHHHFYR